MSSSLEQSLALPFEQAGRLPELGDNVAIAIKTLPAGTIIALGGGSFSLPHTVLEGHRFATIPIASGQNLLSWGLPFGRAIHPIRPGDYICNAKILEALGQRHLDFALPAEPNFKDERIRYALDEKTFQPAEQLSTYTDARTFQGFSRGPKRGAGTRNYIVILGTTSLTASYARALAERFQGNAYPNIDGVVAIAHTEAGERTRPNNYELVLRTLAGFLTNSNVAAALSVDLGTEVLTNRDLKGYMEAEGYPLDELLHEFYTLKPDYQMALDQGEAIIRGWLPAVNACARTPQPLAQLKIGLQCGGSDAFSGVSGNPLVGIVTREVVRHGGSANLAETDELIGAEPYVLQQVRDLKTARAFLKTLDRFQERAGWHGHDAEGNPSGGNNFRGLYNIAIKSIGAARKKDPRVRLDYVIDYGEPMEKPGFYFMDSPGNDLESIAGQIAAGCNLILFTTGNGSITNFPFAPTIKVMTTTNRFNLLAREMDFNAGRYQDGTPMEELGREAFELTLGVASGTRSAGEKAGHSQVQLWREWRQSGPSARNTRAIPTGQPMPFPRGQHAHQTQPVDFARDRVGLIVPTSLCAGQIGKMIADKLNKGDRGGLSRFVALAHTEGCGVSGGESEEIYLRTVTGYLRHPAVAHALLLEHGCEKTHNDALRNYLEAAKVDIRGLGWASIQMDGGIENVTKKACDWFKHAETTGAKPNGSFGPLRIGITSDTTLSPLVVKALLAVIETILSGGGTIVVPANATLLQDDHFLIPRGTQPTLGYGETIRTPGLHLMDTPTGHGIETLTGLGATGVDVMVVFEGERPWQAHPFIPVLQVSLAATESWQRDFDLRWPPGSDASANELLELAGQTASGKYVPKLLSRGNTDFQMTRGLFGVSL